MKSIYLIIILFLFPLFSEESNWATTRFETFWKKTFTQMKYRSPITFSPYDIKIGYLRYGGNDYYRQFGNLFSLNDELLNNPFKSEDLQFPDISNAKNRDLITLQLDLLRYNFFSKYNNKLDVSMGFGYKIIMSQKELFFNNGDKLKPEFREVNFNTTIALQWRPHFYNYLYYSAGYNKAKFYETFSLNKESTGSGVGHTLGFGTNFILSNQYRKSDLHCGFEMIFSKLVIDQNKIFEPDNFNRINSFNMETIGVIFSFGIGYGGHMTYGDKAYLSMLNRDYMLAEEQFLQYKNYNEIVYNRMELDSMISFASKQVPHQQYKFALAKYYLDDLESASDILKKINITTNADLDYKIESLKYTVADKMFNRFIEVQDEYSIHYQIQYYKSLKSLSPKIREIIDQRLFDIYLDRGDYLLNNNSFEEAYEYYIYASTIDNVNSVRLSMKIENLIVSILNDAYNLLQNKENVLAYEKLSFAKDISGKNNNIEFLMEFIQNKISTLKIDNVRDRIIDIINEKRKFVEVAAKKDIYLGDSYDAIVNILGYPATKIERTLFHNNYEMITYLVNNVEHRLFLKNKILIDIERD
tara:strand:- start:911 stop:2662 length:1752 start_codon:yes stop_codon:yes gene_type:complete